MHRYNFPTSKTKRQEGALERLKKATPRDADHAAYIKAQVEVLELKLKQRLI